MSGKEERRMKKCEFPDGVVIKPDGENELDPCFYEEIEKWENVTVVVLKCKKCGHIEHEIYLQDESRKIF